MTRWGSVREEISHLLLRYGSIGIAWPVEAQAVRALARESDPRKLETALDLLIEFHALGTDTFITTVADALSFMRLNRPDEVERCLKKALSLLVVLERGK